MKKGFFLHSIVSLFLALLLSACVGTIEDTGTPNTDAEGGTIKPAAYIGISGVKAISDTRVELYFPPAPGNQENYIYQIYKDKAKQPIEVRFSALRKSYDGLLSYTYKNLSPSTKYSFSVEFKDLSKNTTSRSTNQSINAETLSNQMCDFDGIVDARNANGLAALNTVNVYWFPAKDSGFVVSSEDYDPVKYEIIAISEADGGLDAIEDLNANRIVIPIDINKSFHPVTGLAEGTKYFFQVRCKHKGWDNKGFLEFQETQVGTYRRETNTRFIEIQTKSSGKTPEFIGPFEVLNPLLPEDAESELGVQWEPASGGFAEYRLFYKKLAPGAPTGPGEYDEESMMAADEITEALMDEMVGAGPYAAGCNPRNANCGTIKVVAEDISGAIDGLDKFGFYQVKVVACVTSACDGANRISLDSQLARVIPNIIPFNGITDIEDPSPTIDATRITLKFASPLRDSGYATRLVVRCFQGADDTTPVTFNSDLSAISGSGKAECEGLNLNTTLPAHAGMLNFTEIEIDGVEVNTNRSYCFSVHPEINESSGGLDYIYSDDQNAIIQCITPAVVAPNLQEFAGRRQDVCEFDDTDPNNLKMKVKWYDPLPGGYWTNFRVFWKEYDPASTNADIAGPLNFQKAIDTGNTVGSVYHYRDAAGDSANEYIIGSNVADELIPGKKYHIGVLPFFVLGTDRYGEFNTQTRECVVPYPKAVFNEWTNVVSIGPKVDGRVPQKIDAVTSEWGSTRLFEYLDEYGTPLEVEMDGANSTTPLDPNLRGLVLFNGVYGKEDSNQAIGEGPHQYSNSGVIRIEFKDVEIDHRGADTSYYDDKTTFHDLRQFYMNGEPTKFTEAQEGWKDGINDTTDGSTNKLTRKIGYKILRSDDNKKTWIDLTRYHPSKMPFQKSENDGLVYSNLVTYFKVNGRYRTENERRVVFTDYSVKHYEDDGGIVSRGRVYWYKIVPYIDGQKLEYKDEDTNGHHMLRVVLPPPNMAFVSRLMVNRQGCIELGKEDQIRKEPGQYYSCPYNGIGARSFEKPWNTAATFLDLGGDLLVDRYELGCNWTRGDMTDGAPDSSLSDAIAGSNNDLFDKYKDFTEDSGISGNPLKGCFQLGGQTAGLGSQYSNSEPTNYGPNGVGGDTNFTSKQVIPGDCFGSGERVIYNGSYDNCFDSESNGLTTPPYSLMFPGAFRNQNDFYLGGDCLKPMTGEHHNAEPSLPFNNDTLFPTSTVTNMDPYQAHSEYGAVFYMRDKIRSSGYNYLRTLRRHFSSNSISDSQNRYLETQDRSKPASCFINLYGVSNLVGGASAFTATHETNVRPRWISLNETMHRMRVRAVARDSEGMVTAGAVVSNIDDLYDWKLSKVVDAAQSDLYGGDWDPPSNIQALVENRVTSDMKIGRIMSSNNSKLPQIEGLKQSEYNKLCQQYSVEIGYPDTAGAFVREYPPVGIDPLKKRLARRSEFVAFSAWSDRYGEATVISLEKGDANQTLTDILAALQNSDATETGTSIDPTDSSSWSDEEEAIIDRLDDWEASSCNTQVKHTNNAHRSSNWYDVDLAENGIDRFRQLHPTFPRSKNTNDPNYWSGSSSLDDAAYNSERCVSRYGVQDHIGNLKEMGSDQFWCDANAHEFKLEAGANPINLLTHGFGWFRTNNFPNWNDQVGNTSDAFGECSIRARGNDLGGVALVGTNMVSIYTDYTRQNYNTTLLSNVNSVDPEAVLSARNGGDGEFLSFGENSIIPALYAASGNNLSIKEQAETDAGYFNPVLGLPIRCADVSCATSSDNQLITNPVFHANLKLSEFGPVIQDTFECEDHLATGTSPIAGYPITNCNFPLGNGDVQNYSTHEFDTDSYNIFQASNGGSARNYYGFGDFYADADGDGPIYASEIGTLGVPVDGDLNGDGDIVDVGVDETPDGRISRAEGDAWMANVDNGELTGADFIELVRITPKDQGQAGNFINGGSSVSVDDTPGRYAIDIEMDNNQHLKAYQYAARCVVKIFGSDY